MIYIAIIIVYYKDCDVLVGRNIWSPIATILTKFPGLLSGISEDEVVRFSNRVNDRKPASAAFDAEVCTWIDIADRTSLRLSILLIATLH